MRARIIRPGFWSDQALGRLPIGARLLFAGLWCLADREGRLIDSPRWIAGQLFPYDDDGIDDDVRRWLAMLESGGFIVRYESEGTHCIAIANFKKHQPIHPKESASTLPPPSETKRRHKRGQETAEPRTRRGNSTATLRSRHGNSTASHMTTSEVPTSEFSDSYPVEAVTEISRLGHGISTAEPGRLHGGITSTSTTSIPTSTSGAVRKLPNTPPTPHGSSPPPLAHAEMVSAPAHSAPAIERRAGSIESAPKQDLPEVSSGQAAGMPAAAAGVAQDAPTEPWTASPCGRPAARALRPNLRNISGANTGMQRLGDFAVEVTRRMLLDWMERQAGRLPPPDDEICRRLVVAHGMSLDRLRAWLLWLRRRGKRPESVQSWGWFVHLAEVEGTSDEPTAEAMAAGGAA